MAFGKKKKNKNKNGNQPAQETVVVHKVAPGENVLYPPREGSVLKEMSTAIGCTVVALVLVGFIVSQKSIAIAGYQNYENYNRGAAVAEQEEPRQEEELISEGDTDDADAATGNQAASATTENNGNEAAAEPAGDYILPGSDTRYIEDSEISNLSAEDLSRARNEIYARHGRLFRDQNLQDYFNSKSWYSGTISPDSFTEGMLSDLERANVEKIVAMERTKGYR